tara:strand:+ start:1678 stop:2238 length:561 start_codon:yes stop_codon:yes gene_type:complete
MKSFKNKFLYFIEKVPGDFFSNTLIYLCEHDGNGAFGFIVNQPTDLTVSKFLSTIGNKSNNQITSFERLMRGGPVDLDKVFMLHNDRSISNANTSPLTDRLFLTSAPEVINSVNTEFGPDKFKLLLGYCGWSSNQLELEIKNNSWHVIDANTDLIFDEPTHNLISAVSEDLGYDLSKVTGESKKVH